MKWFLLVLSTATFVLMAQARATVFEPREFQDPAQEERYKSLVAELRCLVCQNQNLADSNAELAGDLRRQVFTMIEAGASDEEIVDFMVSRYGDFVLYRPPLKATTLLLWVGPFVLGAAAVAYLAIQVRRRNQARADGALTEAERRRLNELLDSSEEPEGR